MANNEEIKKYIGKTIKSFKFASDTLKFEFDDNDELVLYAQGDCCSNSFFAQISGEEALIPNSKLLSMRFISLDKNIQHDEYELEQFYGIKIKTTNGWADIDMRNMSNGYYGGFITVNDNDQYCNHSIYFWDEVRDEK